MPLNARDSLADLQKLYQESKTNEDKFHVIPPSSTSRSNGTEGNDNDNENEDIMFFDAEEEEQQEEEEVTGLKDKSGKTQEIKPQKTTKLSKLKVSKNTRKHASSSSSSSSSNKKATGETAVTASYYTGFDYTTYNSDYDYHSYADPYALSSSTSSEDKNIFCCFFPNNQETDSDDSDDEGKCNKLSTSNHNLDFEGESDVSIDESRHNLHEDDLSLSSSSTIGTESREGKEEAKRKDRIKADGDSPSLNKMTIDIQQKKKNEETNGIANAATNSNNNPKSSPSSKKKEKKPLKGILKHIVTKPDIASQTKNNSSERTQDNKNQEPGRRRSILPSYAVQSFDENNTDDNSKVSSSSQTKPRLKFSPMAKVVNIPSRGEMSYYTRSLIWWQRNDYDDFKKTGRIIAKAMVCGGSEIWLQTSNAWGKQQGKGGHLNDATNGTKKDGEEKGEDVGSKWWCKFGHSRRGLEHIVSIEEGKQRQRFVNLSVKAVLEEQRRQRMTTKDPKKIAGVSLQYTSWARDLSAAAGAADAEAVESNFNSGAKCRIHHLKTTLNGVGQKIDRIQNQHVPCATFVVLANSALTARVLDANIHIHRRKLLSQKKEEEKGMFPVNQIAKKAAGFQFQKEPNETKVPI